MTFGKTVEVGSSASRRRRCVEVGSEGPWSRGCEGRLHRFSVWGGVEESSTVKLESPTVLTMHIPMYFGSSGA
jgi:hypothetical protein